MTAFASLLSSPGVEEQCVLRGPLGVMAYHGGALEIMTDVIAERVAEATDASFYAVRQPDGMRDHLPSTKVRPAESERLAAFIGHVEVDGAEGAGYQEVTLCIPTKFSGRRVTIEAYGTGGGGGCSDFPNAETTFVDDVTIGTDPACAN